MMTGLITDTLTCINDGIVTPTELTPEILALIIVAGVMGILGMVQGYYVGYWRGRDSKSWR